MKGLHRHTNRRHGLLYLGIKWSVFILLLTGVGTHLFAQTSKKERQISLLSNIKYDVQPLTVGDKVPDILFHNVLNYKSKTAKISDFKGKLVILDMWSVYCTSCITGFPKMENLQKEFGDKIQILLVNSHDAKYDSEEKIKATLSKLKARTGFYPSLPIPIHDSILNRYFPHESVPHQVWIDGDRNVVAITGSNSATNENIRKFLSGQKFSVGMKNDWGFDKSKPLLFDENGGRANDFIFRSIFTKYRDAVGYSSGTRLNKQGDVIGLFMLNKTLTYFISAAYGDLMNDIPNNRILFEIENHPERFKRTFDTMYAYCYDLTIPPTPAAKFDFKTYLRQDLNLCFNISVRKEKRKMNCLIIGQTDKLSKSSTKYTEKQIDIEESSIHKYIHNHSIQNIIELLDRFEKPMISEIDLLSNIDIDFPVNSNLSDVHTVLQALRDIGFKIHEEERIIDVIVVSDK